PKALVFRRRPPVVRGRGRLLTNVFEKLALVLCCPVLTGLGVEKTHGRRLADLEDQLDAAAGPTNPRHGSRTLLRPGLEKRRRGEAEQQQQPKAEPPQAACRPKLRAQKHGASLPVPVPAPAPVPAPLPPGPPLSVPQPPVAHPGIGP